MTWRPVRGYEDLYLISEDGVVRSGRRQGSAGGVVRQTVQPSGYAKVCLYRDGKRRAAYVHRLVLESYTGLAPEGTEACHRNGDRADNRLANLRWDTRSANYDDARRHGTAAIGARNPMTKVDGEARAMMRARRAGGALQRELASEFGLSQQHVSAILREQGK